MSTPSERPRTPETRRATVTETLHGTDVPDPYRWLEPDDDPEVEAWVDAQNEYADALLDSPTRDRLRPELEDLAEVGEYGSLTVRGGRYFGTVRDPEDDHARLVVRDEPDGDPTALVDPNAWDANRDDDRPPRSLSWAVPANDGAYVAAGVTEGGDENYDVRVIPVPGHEGAPDDVARGEAGVEPVVVLPDRGRVNAGMFAWRADDDGFYYVATGGAADGAQMDKEVRHWRFGDREGADGDGDPGDEEVLLEHDDRHVWPQLTVDPDTGLLAVGFSEMVGGTDWSVLVDGDLRPVIAGSDADTHVRFHDGTAFLRTDHEAPRNRLLACSVERFREGDLGFDDCREVLPEREGILQSAAPTPDHLLVHYQTDAHSRLAVHDRDGTHERDLDLPDYRTVTWVAADRDAPEAFYGVTSFDQPPTTMAADLETGARERLAQVDVDADVVDDLVVEQAFVESTDGADVPVFVCHREGVDRDGDNPALLYGYGGFRNSVTPTFGRFRLPFLADGGVFAVVCARGGYEYGEAWHEAGMLADKQHTFDDFVAAGEWLVDAGYTSPDRLGVAGGSNGGLSVGAVLTQRPDLFGAVQCEVPLLDMLRFHRFLLGESWTTEYGHPETDPEAFAYIREYSPYHNVEADVDYPPVFFRTAASDTRVHPCHARKMAARMQAEADGGPFLLRTKTDTGHGIGRPTSMVVDEQVDAWTFLYDALGLGEGALAGREA